MTAIEWAEQVWNPLAGCTPVSPGCDGCYAISWAHRLAAMPHTATSYGGLTVKPDTGPVEWTGQVNLITDALTRPARTKKPTTWFVNSMSDLYHPNVPVTYIARVFAHMVTQPGHRFIVLTKRPERMAKITNDPDFTDQVTSHAQADGLDPDLVTLPAPNIVMGASIETDRYSFRANHVRATTAAVRALSLEPLLGPLPGLDLTGIDWVIVGGESGHQARPMHPDWVTEIYNQTQQVGVAFFFKQWGRYRPFIDGADPEPRTTVSYDPDDPLGRWEPMVTCTKKTDPRTIDGRPDGRRVEQLPLALTQPTFLKKGTLK